MAAGTRRTSPLEIRGIMLDLARLIERHEFYFDLLGRLAEWGFNTLWWHFVDDQGFMLKLDSHPELASPHAFTKAEMRRLIAAAGELGIDVVPEVETLGHGRYITSLPQYAHLADGDPRQFNAICPSHRDTLKLLGEIIHETAELFPSPFFHAGLDEADLSGCKRCARRAKGKPRWWLYGEHTKAMREIIAAAGKRMVMWGDHIEHDPALLKALPKDILIAHWNYDSVHTEAIERSLKAGFEVVGAPSLMWYSSTLHPNARQWTNVEEMTATARRLKKDGMLGVVNTWWCTWRHLRDNALPMVAYTGHLLTGGKADRVEFLRRYLAHEHGLRSKTAAEALLTLHEHMITAVFDKHELLALTWDNLGDLLACVELAGKEGFAERAAALRHAADVLTATREKVSKNAEAFAATALSAEVAAGLLENALAMREAHRLYLLARRQHVHGYEPARLAEGLGQAAELMQRGTDRLELYRRAGEREWNRTRYRDDARKHTRDLDRPCSHDAILGRLARGERAQKALVKTFARAVRGFLRGGKFPGGF